MPKPNRLKLAKDNIFELFSVAPQKAYSQPQLAALLVQNRHSWHLATHTTVNDFISFLTKYGELKVCKFRSSTYRHELTRYSWGKSSPYELALSIKPRAYFSHATAAAFHGFAKLSSKTIYLNSEQSPKTSPLGALTQEGIDRAFSREQRRSNLIYTYSGISVTVISGKNTNRLGVEETTGQNSETLPITNLERTLIDIVVRPAYAGGLFQVLKAYRMAKNRVSVDRLLSILKKLDYVYPYHQSIGFLMQKAGYPEQSYAKLRTLGLSNDFYLAHSIEHADYSSDWRLFYPKRLSS